MAVFTSFFTSNEALLYNTTKPQNTYFINDPRKVIPYLWLEFDDRWDFVVGIAVNGKPVSMGSFIDEDIVITSANPLEKYRYPPMNKKIEIYYINGSYGNSGAVLVDCISTTFFEDRKRFWVPHGKDGTHSPLHDLLLIRVKFSIAGHSFTERRLPFISLLIQPSSFISTRNYAFAGFGYIDKEHIQVNHELEMEFYEGNVRVDCDEYIPREWGKFICINDTFRYSGLTSGAPLVHNYELIGVGSFMLTKNEDHILVFTDLKPYRYFMGFCKFNKKQKRYERLHWITYAKEIFIGWEPNKP